MSKYSPEAVAESTYYELIKYLPIDVYAYLPPAQQASIKEQGLLLSKSAYLPMGKQAYLDMLLIGVWTHEQRTVTDSAV